jgi:hypothetical protein
VQDIVDGVGAAAQQQPAAQAGGSNKQGKQGKKVRTRVRVRVCLCRLSTGRCIDVM